MAQDKREYIEEQDLQMLRYFWDRKEDIESWCDYEKIKKSLKKERPDILIESLEKI